MSLLGSATRWFNTEATVFRHFADHYDMVYFGRFHQEDDEQHIVRGVTMSNQHHDEHYCVGTVHGYDVILLKRTDTITMPSRPKSEKYSWSIMQFDLHTTYDFPHVFLDGGHHSEAFYQTLFIKFSRLMRVEKSMFGAANLLFNNRFSAYTPPDALDDLPLLLTEEIMETMAHHFSHLDFEWFQDRLIVYSTGRMPTKHLLEHMLRAGLWLARELDEAGQQKTSAATHTVTADVPTETN